MNSFNENTVEAYEAETRCSQLLERVAVGKEITIIRHGSPVARLVAVFGGSDVRAPDESRPTRVR